MSPVAESEWTVADYLMAVESVLSDLLDNYQARQSAATDEERAELIDEWARLDNRARALIATGPPE